MAEVEVPWSRPVLLPVTTPGIYTGIGPASQSSTWSYAARGFRIVAGLAQPLDAMAERLRLNVERSWEDLVSVDAVMFRIQEIDFAFSRVVGCQSPDVHVWLSRERTDVDSALDVLLGTLGIAREALTFCGEVEAEVPDLRISTQV